MQLGDESAHLRGVERREAPALEQREERLEVAAVDVEAAGREPPLVREGAEVFLDRGSVRVRGRLRYRRAASAAAVSSPIRRR